MEQGEIYYGDFVEFGRNPVLVLSREALNQGNRVLVALIASKRFAYRSRLPNCVPFEPGDFGLGEQCVAQCENLAYLSKDRMDAPPIGKLDDITRRTVIKAVGNVLEADCEPE